jgi:hypothetical protein
VQRRADLICFSDWMSFTNEGYPPLAKVDENREATDAALAEPLSPHRQISPRSLPYRQVSDESVRTDFTADGTWSRCCTEDVCPVRVEKPSAGPTEPRIVQLILADNPNSTCMVMTDMKDLAINLRQQISDATGTPLPSIQLVMNKTSSPLQDHELIPSPVTVRGTASFPKGSVLIGRAQFLQILSEVRNLFINDELLHKFMESISMSTENEMTCAEQFIMIEQVNSDRPNSLHSTFDSIADMNAFYLSSYYCQDPEFQVIYSEIDTLLGHNRDKWFQRIGVEEDPLMIGG